MRKKHLINNKSITLYLQNAWLIYVIINYIVYIIMLYLKLFDITLTTIRGVRFVRS